MLLRFGDFTMDWDRIMFIHFVEGGYAVTLENRSPQGPTTVRLTGDAALAMTQALQQVPLAEEYLRSLRSAEPEPVR